ncbi:hypothetical protein OROHE_013462 [Orobanche hederae]
MVFQRDFGLLGWRRFSRVGGGTLRVFVSHEERKLLQVVWEVSVAGGERSIGLKFRFEFPAAGGSGGGDFSGDVFFDELYVVSLRIAHRSQWGS